MASVVILSAPTAEGDGFADDFEWKVPVRAPENGYEQYVETIEVDEVTGETYLIWMNYEPFSGGSGPVSSVLSRVNTTTMELDQVASVPYLGSSRYHLVHDGIWYLFYQTRDDNNYLSHLRIVGEDSDRLTWDSTVIDALGVYKGQLQVVALQTASGGGRKCDLYSIDIETFEWSWLPLFDLKEYSRDWEFILRDGVVYCVNYLATEGWEQDYVELNTYRIGSLVWKDPVLLCWWDFVNWYWFEFGVDSRGNVHLLMTSNCTLMKYSPDGELLATTRLPPPVDEEGARWHGGSVIVNRTDCVFVVGTSRVNASRSVYIVSQAVPGDYSSLPVSHVIYEDAENTGVVLAALNASGRIHVGFASQIEDNGRAAVSFQIDRTPDLFVPGRYLRVEERRGAERPLELTVLIKNVGKVASTSHWVTVYRRSVDGGPFTRVLQRSEDVRLDPGGKYWLTVTMRLPRGNCLLRVEVHDVVPFENFRHNNVADVRVYVSTNNPPDLLVSSPVNGTTVEDLLTLSGTTVDFDGDTNLTTTIWGLPIDDLEIDGQGDWDLTLDLAGVPSGDYNLMFRATDGEDVSKTEMRWIRVDHAEESLILGGFHPDADVSLLVGEDEWFFFNVTDRFSRALTFEWALDDSPLGTKEPFHRFLATEPGSFSLEVTVTNGRMWLRHRWNVTVREPVMPCIADWSPRGPVEVMKREPIELSISVDNPDGVPASISWLVDGQPGIEGADLCRTYRFVRSSYHNISAVLMASGGSDLVTWQVRVLNTPPELLTWSPPQLRIRSRGPTTVDFSVESTDAEGDELTYTWDSRNVTIASREGGSCCVEFVEEGLYQVSVRVSDGEDQVDIEWTVEVEEGEPPVTGPERDPLTWAVLILIASIVVCAYYLHTRRRGGSGEVVVGASEE